LSMVTLGRQQQYAVVVDGTSWKLDLLALPSGVKPGSRVLVLGQLVLRKSKPIVRVKKIKKA